MASFWSFLSEQWTTLPVPELPLDGKTIIITGSNIGLGFEAAKHVARLNAATLILAVRNTTAGEDAAKTIRSLYPNSKTDIQVWKIDQASFASVKSFAERVDRELPKLDSAILNAGIATGNWNVTDDGWEQTIEVNVLSTTYLALLLLPKLQSSVDRSSTFKPHCTIVASDVHFWTPMAERKQQNILATLNDKAHHNPKDRYQVSKLLDVYITQGIAGYFTKQGKPEVVVNCLNPGFCHSELMREQMNIFNRILKAILCRTTEVGSRTLVHAGLVTGDESMGKYLSSCRVTQPAPMVTTDEGKATQQRVWQEVGDVLSKVDPAVAKYWA